MLYRVLGLHRFITSSGGENERKGIETESDCFHPSSYHHAILHFWDKVARSSITGGQGALVPKISKECKRPLTVPTAVVFTLRQSV